ncbi:unnamed protein product [Mytilus edulis]|uniref:Uncharacterized protein n=1 Tax=Mytilus edulis TaxID=6550 RepID=A0A8S3RTX8_MYTED|nr:unnamed protein product [Mytilus edulis]
MSQLKKDTKKEEKDEDEGGDSIWLCNVLDNIALNDDFRNICQEVAFTNDILLTFMVKIMSVYRVGSSCEGTAIQDVDTDIDLIHCDERFPVIEDISKADKNGISLLVVTESKTPVGYVKLQLVVSTVPDLGFACLLDIKSSNIHKYVRLRGFIKETKTLQAESVKVKNKTAYVNEVGTKQTAVYAVSELIEQFKVYEHEINFIEFLWCTLSDIQHVVTVSEHTPQETRRALSILEPFFYTCLASNISAMCIQQPNSQVRDFLFTWMLHVIHKGDLAGRLKFISVLYAVGCYRECIWY